MHEIFLRTISDLVNLFTDIMKVKTIDFDNTKSQH